MEFFVNINSAIRAFGWGRTDLGNGPRPERPLAVIGDVHGCYAQMDTLLKQIAQEAPAAQIVLLGDMIDRGPDSRAVLARVRDLENAVVLRGNHEQMLLDALDEPLDETRNGARWMRNGGQQTLDSFGITAPWDGAASCAALRAAMPPGLEEWLRSRPLWWQSGNVVAVHAGAAPRQSFAHQDPDHLLWGHPAFGQQARPDGLWVVHGHTIVAKPRLKNGVISVDTGAYRGGALSAALISDTEMRFLGVTR